MAALLDALSSTELLNFIIYDTISATPPYNYTTTDTAYLLDQAALGGGYTSTGGRGGGVSSLSAVSCRSPASSDINNNININCNIHSSSNNNNNNLAGQKPNARKASVLGGGAAAATQGPRKKRRRRPRVCKNKEEAETQRMTHIAVERNRRKQMNEHLAVLRSLMPDSYVQRGDQASIVGGAIEFVKELEHLLQSMEAQKLQHKLMIHSPYSQSHSLEDQETTHRTCHTPTTSDHQDISSLSTSTSTPPFSQFFVCPQYTWSQQQLPNTTKYANNAASNAVADIEVTLIETHANLRILSRRCGPRQLSRLVAGFHTLHLSILHLNVTTLHPLVLYSISAKVEEGCQLTTVDDIAGAVHHMLRIIEEGEVVKAGAAAAYANANANASSLS